MSIFSDIRRAVTDAKERLVTYVETGSRIKSCACNELADGRCSAIGVAAASLVVVALGFITAIILNQLFITGLQRGSVQISAAEFSGASTVLQAIGFGIPVVLFAVLLDDVGVGKRLRNASPAVMITGRIPSRSDIVTAGIGFLVMLGLLTLYQLGVQLFNAETATNSIVKTARRDPTLLLFLVPLSFLAIGTGEELLFRGALQGSLTNLLGQHSGIIAASVLFSVAHVPALLGGGVPASLFILFLLGITLGYAYEYTNNLVVPILMHGAYNALLFATLYLRLTGAL